MKSKSCIALCAATLLTGVACAQTATAGSSSAKGVVPSSAPVASVVVPAAPPAPNQFVYSPRLPTPVELCNAAAAQGLTVERIEQATAQIVATYKDPSGKTNTVLYRILPVANTGAPVPASPPPTFFAEQAPRVVYYDYYDPFYRSPIWYPRASIRMGFGFGHRGGFRHRR